VQTSGHPETADGPDYCFTSAANLPQLDEGGEWYPGSGGSSVLMKACLRPWVDLVPIYGCPAQVFGHTETTFDGAVMVIKDAGTQGTSGRTVKPR